MLSYTAAVSICFKVIQVLVYPTTLRVKLIYSIVVRANPYTVQHLFPSIVSTIYIFIVVWTIK